ncbi:MAG: peptidoglycan DD-metalloendopeptidase family protein [Mucinivorans sp.]
MLRSALIACFALYSMVCYGQKESLERQIETAQKEIARIDGQINNNKAQQKNSAENLRLINLKITNRTKMLRNMDAQVEVIKFQIINRDSLRAAALQEYSQMQSQVAHLLGVAYSVYRASNSGAELLDWGNSSAAAARNMAYVRHIALEVSAKAAAVDSMRQEIEKERNGLGRRVERLENLLTQRSDELRLLDSERQSVSKMKESLSVQQEELNTQLLRQRAAVDELQRRINALVAQESGVERSKEELLIDKKLEARFDQNRGRLPSPINGVVVGHFGRQAHPSLRSVVVNNKGVNLEAEVGATVSSIFDGQVRRVFLVDGMGASVIIRHGQYLSVYSNLTDISVKVGQSVTTGQSLGRVLSGSDEQKGYLHLEIWRETQNMNPEEWVAFLKKF